MTQTDHGVTKAALVFEKDGDNVVWARYRDPPHNSIPRWKVGTSNTLGQPVESKLSYRDFNNMQTLAKKNENFAQQFSKTLTLYYMLSEQYDL